MTLNAVAELVANRSLRARIAAAAAMRGISNPDGWAASKAWLFAAQPGWAEAWDQALAAAATSAPSDTARRTTSIANGLLSRRQLDPGAREDVITDQMIATALAAVEAYVAPRQQV